MLEGGGVLKLPPELEAELIDYGRMLAEYLRNLRTKHKPGGRTHEAQR